jgi:cysteine desulfurase
MSKRPTIINHRPSSGRSAVYLDHHATTPIDPRVAQVVFDTMTVKFGNAHSVDHVYGQTAAALVQQAAAEVADLLRTSPDHIRFTSGATEAIRIALGIAAANTKCLRVGVSRVEHKAVLEPLVTLEQRGRATLRWIDVDSAGRVSLDNLAQVVTDGVDLVCLMAANNEVGTVYPVKEAAALAAANRAEILVDATAAAGRIPIKAEDWGIDYLVLSAHKVYGPKGAGALVGPSARTPLADSVFGHAGTLNVPCIVGFGEACRLQAAEGSTAEAQAIKLRDQLEATLTHRIPNLVINGDLLNRLGNNLHISVPGAPNDAVTSRLHDSVAISTGAACSSGAQEPSHVLRAMGLSPELQETALRMSTGKFNTVEEIEFAASEIASAVAEVRAARSSGGLALTTTGSNSRMT